MPAQVTFLTYDRLNKDTSMTIRADTLVSAPDVQALANAIDAIILGTDVRATSSIVTIVDGGAQGPSAEDFASRGNKWLFRVSAPLDNDGAGAVYQHEIGTADNAALPAPGSDFLDLTTGVGATLKGAFEQVYESPDGNPGTLLSVQQVSRGLN